MSTPLLLVDDEAPIALVLATSLTAHGYNVRVVGTGSAALEAIAHDPPAVLLLDVNLPDITGWEVLRRLPPEQRAAVPVIVLSASPLAPSRVQEFRPDGILVKPFPIDALLRLVYDLVQRSREDNAHG